MHIDVDLDVLVVSGERLTPFFDALDFIFSMTFDNVYYQPVAHGVGRHEIMVQ